MTQNKHFDPLSLLLLDTIGTPACILDESGCVLASSTSAQKLLGKPQNQLLGVSLFGILGLDLSRLTENREVMDDIHFPNPFQFPLGSGKNMLLRCTLKRIPGEGASRWIFVIKDWEDQAYPLITNDEKSFRRVLETIPDGVIIFDGRGRIEYVNRAASSLFGYEVEYLLGRNVNSLLSSVNSETTDDTFSKAFEDCDIQLNLTGREVLGKRCNGFPIPLLLSVGEIQKEYPRRFVGILHDLTMRRLAEERLNLLSSAVEQAPAGILISDLKGNVDYINQGFTRLTGFLPTEVIGVNLFSPGSIIPSIAGNRSLCHKLLSSRDWHGEIRDRNKAGNEYSALVTFSPIQDSSGCVIRLLGRFQDITQQKIDQEALIESERRFSEVALMVGEWLWEQDSSGHYTYCSDAVEHILGYPPEAIIGRHYLELLTEADRQLWSEVKPAQRRQDQPFSRLINHYQHRDGHKVYTESTGTPIYNDSGAIIKWRGVDLDITERKHVEDAMRLRERAIEAASVGIAIADARSPDYPTIYINPALCRISGYEQSELLGRSLRMLQGRGTDDYAREKMRVALQNGSPFEVVIRNYRKDGSAFWNELLLSPVRDNKGVLTHYIGIISDVSERRLAEDERHELEIAREIQMSLLPKMPLVTDSIVVAGVCVPATQVGGDYFDFNDNDDWVDVVIADVSGHSVGAALIMAEMRSALKAESRRDMASSTDSTAGLLTVLNQLLFDDLNGAELFITLFYLRFDQKTRLLRFANAGHNRPLLFRRTDSRIIELDADGLILGVRRDVTFQEAEVELVPGDIVLLYTDGVTETRNEKGDFFGVDGLAGVFADHKAETPQQILDTILEELRSFRGESEIQDDITLVVMAVR